MIRPAPRISWSYHPELDGLRALAMVVIVFFHARATGASNTFIALDLFFVLSGFLVTNVVLSEIDATGTLRLRRFYARRVRRLLPAAVLAILSTSVLVLLIYPQTVREEFIRDAQAALVYLANWQFIADSRDYFATDMMQSPFMHYWSLSVEEQYYIAFPLLVLAVLKLAPGRTRVFLGVLSAIFVLSLISQIVSAQVSPLRAYYATDARLFQLIAGAILAVVVRELALKAHAKQPPDDDRPAEAHWPLLGPLLAGAGLAGYVLLGSELLPMQNSVRNILATFLAGAMVVGMYAAPQSWLSRLFARPAPVYLGKISYGTYLWHWPLVLVIGDFTTVRPAAVAVGALVLATALAALSYELLETPIRRAKLLNPFEWRAVASGLTVSVLAAAVVVAPLLSSARTPSVVLAEDASGQAEVVAEQKQVEKRLSRDAGSLDLKQLQKRSGPSRRWCGPEAPEKCQVVDNDGPHVVLVGDSHGMMLSKALSTLAEEKGFRFSMSVTMGCAFQHRTFVSDPRDEGNKKDCEEARDRFYTQTLPAMEPDLVILTGLARTGEDWNGRLEHRGKLAEDSSAAVAEATEQTVGLVQDAGANAVLVKPVITTGGWDTHGPDPIACLEKAQEIGECTVEFPTERPAEDAIYESLAITEPGTGVIDLNPIACPNAPVCLPVLGERLVWKDAFHLHDYFVTDRRDEIWKRITDTGLMGE